MPDDREPQSGMQDNVTVEVADGVQTIRFDRPEKSNALTSEMYEIAADAISIAERDSRVRVILIAGPYIAPAVKRGGVATCLFRDDDVIITSWSDGRIAWPRCQRPRQHGGSGLLVTEELVRAIKTESSIAVQYWFGVNGETVWRWRNCCRVMLRR